MAESGRANSTAEQIQRSSETTNSSALAAESLQVQRQAFLSVILSYLSKPEDNPPEVSDENINRSDEVTKNDLKTAGQSWSQFADSSIHLRVLRSTSEPEARALFFRRRASNPPNNPPRRHQLATRPSTAVGQPAASELTDLLMDDLQRRRNQQFVNGEAEETSATIEVVQTRTPFVITSSGQMIMNDLPMVF